MGPPLTLGGRWAGLIGKTEVELPAKVLKVLETGGDACNLEIAGKVFTRELLASLDSNVHIRRELQKEMGGGGR